MRSFIVALMLLGCASSAQPGIQQMLLASPLLGNPTASLPASANLESIGFYVESVRLEFGTTGLEGIAFSGAFSSTWRTQGYPPQFQVRMVFSSGDAFNVGQPVNTWLNVPQNGSYTYSWGYFCADLPCPTLSMNGTLQIRNAVGGAVLASMPIAMYSESTG